MKTPKHMPTTTPEIAALLAQIGKPPKTPQELNEMIEAFKRDEISREEMEKARIEIDAWIKKSGAYFRAITAAIKGGQP